MIDGTKLTGFAVGLLHLPKNAGRWKLPGGNTYLYATERPRWLTRKLMYWLLEFKWEDEAK